MNVHPMTTWTIKSRTDDPDLALDIFEDLQYKGYSAWIEDENGNAIDEKSLERTPRLLRNAARYIGDRIANNDRDGWIVGRWTI